MIALANGGDQDEIPQNAAFHQCRHSLHEILHPLLLQLFISFTWASPYGTHMKPGCTAHMGPI